MENKKIKNVKKEEDIPLEDAFESDVRFYLDFSIEGSVRSSEKDIDLFKESLNKLVSGILEKKDLGNINVTISKFSDIDIALAAMVVDDEYH